MLWIFQKPVPCCGTHPRAVAVFAFSSWPRCGAGNGALLSGRSVVPPFSTMALWPPPSLLSSFVVPASIPFSLGRGTSRHPLAFPLLSCAFPLIKVATLGCFLGTVLCEETRPALWCPARGATDGQGLGVGTVPPDRAVSHATQGYWPLRRQIHPSHARGRCELPQEGVSVERTFLGSAGRGRAGIFSFERMLTRRRSDTRPSFPSSASWAVASALHVPTVARRGEPAIAKGQDLCVLGSGNCEARACFPKPFVLCGYADGEKWGWLLVPIH